MDGAGVMLDVLSAYLPFSFVSYMHEFHLLHSHSLFFSPSFRCALGYVFFLPIFLIGIYLLCHSGQLQTG